MKDRNEKIMFKACLFTVSLSAVMLLFSVILRGYEREARAQAIVEASERSAALSSEAAGNDGAKTSPDVGGGLLLTLKQTDSMYVCVPLPENVTSSGITAENHYMDGQLWLRMPNTDFLFYSGKSITGDISKVRQAAAFQDSNGTIVRLALDNIYEYDLISENQNLYIQLVAPREKYDRVIVVDPAAGDGGDATLAVAEKLSGLVGNSKIRIYQTRMTGESCPQEKVAALANAVRADMLIRISVENAEDSGEYGTFARYSEDYYIPGFSGADLADTLLRNVATQLRTETRGLEQARKEDIAIRKARVPAAEIVLGYISNAQERKLLSRDDYREKAARGIYEAVNAAYEIKGKK